MSRRSITGPVIIILIGLFFLINNVRPDLISLAVLADYWPFLLIAAGVIGLIEVLFQASRGSAPPPRPFGGGLIFWILVFSVLFAVLSRNRGFRFDDIDVRGANFLGTEYDYNVNAVEPAQGITRIVLDNIRGDLSIKGDDSGEVKVTGKQTVRAFNRNAADRAKSNSDVHVERDGDSLVIREDEVNRPRFMGLSTDLVILVPKDVRVESRGRNGDLAMDNLAGSIEVSSGRGDVRLNQIARDVRIDGSRGGDIHAASVLGSFYLEGRGANVDLENIAGTVTIKGEFSGTLDFKALAKPLEFTSSHTEFRTEAIPGSVEMDLGDLTLTNVSGPVRFQSGTRDIQAKDVTELLDLQVDHGDIHLTATKTPLPKIDVHTRNGNVSLSIPESAGFQLDGSTAQGEIDNAFGSSVRVDSSGHSATVHARNGSGPEIRVSTDRGDLAIQKN